MNLIGLKRGSPLSIRLKLVALLLFCGHGAQTANAQATYLNQAGVKSLIEVYELAKENATDLAIAKYRWDSAVAERDIARGRNFPQVSLFGDWSENKFRYEEGPMSLLPSQEYPGERYGLQLRTPILNIRSFREYERTSFIADQVEIELSVVKSRLLSDVAQAYLSVLLTTEDLDQVKAEQVALEEQFAEAEALHQRRLLAITDLLETQTRLDAVKADVVLVAGKRSIALERLSQLLGVRGISPLSVESDIQLVNNLISIEHAEERAVSQDPAIAAALEAVRAAEKGVSREKGTWWPEIDFVYSAQYSDVGFDNLTSPPRSTESVSISMRYPLFEGGAGAARLKKAWADFYRAKEELEAAKRSAVGRARSAWVGMEAARERVAAENQALETSDTSLDAARKAVKAGTAKVTDVLVALAQRTRAKRNLSEARYQFAMRWLELGLATGQDPDALANSLSFSLAMR